MNKKIIFIAAFLGMLSVIIGAFGAHGLKESISIDALQTFETGVRYQMYHALMLLFVGISQFLSLKSKSIIFYLVLIGVVFFSGSIYGLATNELTSFDFKKIAFITPFGGLFLITSWVVLLFSVVKAKF